MHIRRFLIPENAEVMVELIGRIPDYWSWVDGRLNAPDDLLARKKAVAGTGFSISRSHSIGPTIIGETAVDREKRDPDLYAILVDQKLPEFIYFDEAGYGDRIVTLSLAKRIAVGYVRRGYRGKLYFYSDSMGNDKFYNCARSELALEPWQGAPCMREEEGNQPARIKLEWQDDHGEELIAPVVIACGILALTEYEPILQT